MGKTKIDKKFFYGVTTAYNEIFETYKIMAQAEIKNDNILYNECKKKITELIKHSEILINNKKLTNNEVRDYMEYISEKEDFDCDIDNVDIILKLAEKDNVSYRRMFYRLEQEVVKGNKFMEEIALNVFNVPDTSPKSIKDQLTKKAMYLFNFKKLINDDSLRLFITKLERQKNETSELVKKELITSKYDTMYLFPQVEDAFFKGQLMDTPFYLSSKLYSDLANINGLEYSQNKNLFCVENAVVAIDNLLNICDMDMSTIEGQTKAIVNRKFLQCYLVQMDLEFLEKLNGQYHDTIESKNYLKVHPNDSYAINMISNSFNFIKRDKKNVRMLTFKP